MSIFQYDSYLLCLKVALYREKQAQNALRTTILPWNWKRVVTPIIIVDWMKGSSYAHLSQLLFVRNRFFVVERIKLFKDKDIILHLHIYQLGAYEGKQKKCEDFAEILGVVKRVFYFCNVEMTKRSSLRNLSGYVK